MSVAYSRPRSRRLSVRLSVELLEARNVPSVYSPAQIRHAYGIDQIAFNGVKGDGAGQTIAIVDAYYDSSIQSDLAAFSQRFGLPQLDGKPGDGLFTQLDLSGHTPSPPNDDWSIETALDVEWAHAVAPRANILLVEAASDFLDATGKPVDLLSAVQTAGSQPGVSTVSMSWGLNEVPAETSWDSVFTQPGVTYVAASGDSGAGTIWPAVSPNVLSVGGTTLRLTASNTISSETGWGHGSFSWFFGGSGGGFSQFEPLPSFQTNAGISPTLTQFGVRLNPDVAYDADPNTGFVIVSAGNLYGVGGTSAGAPQWAALVAIADQGRALAGQSSLSSSQTLSTVYANPTAFHDITKGSTGAYEVVDSSGNIVGQINVAAGPGYDMVTGQGSPIAPKVVSTLVGNGGGAAAPLLAPLNPTGPTSGSHHHAGAAVTSAGNAPSAPGATVAQGPARIDAMGLIASNAPALQVAPASLFPGSVNVAVTAVFTPSSNSFLSVLDGGYAGSAVSVQDDATDGASSDEEEMAAQMLQALTRAAGFMPEVTFADDGATPRFDFGVGSSRVDLQACKLEYSIVSPK